MLRRSVVGGLPRPNTITFSHDHDTFGHGAGKIFDQLENPQKSLSNLGPEVAITSSRALATVIKSLW